MTAACVTKEELKQAFLGKEAHVIYHNGNFEVDTWGRVTRIEDGLRIYGTWGPDPVVYGLDYISTKD